MKHFKKFFSYLVALTMVLSLAAFTGTKVHAVDGTAGTSNSLTIKNNGETAHIFELYQIFTGTKKADSNTLGNIEWGSSVTKAGQDALGAAKDYAKKLDKEEKTQTAKISAEDFAKILAKGDGTTSYLSSPIKTMKADPNQNATFEVEKSGYYLVKDKKGSQTDAVKGAYTDYIVQVVGNVNVDTKLNVPTTIKKVKENHKAVNVNNEETDANMSSVELGDHFNDVADYDVGDDIKYELIGSLPDNYNNYDEYYYQFTDIMDKGLTRNNDVKAYYSNNNGENWTEIKSGFNASGTSKYENTEKTTFTVEFANLKEATDENGTIALNSNSKIKVTFSAKLNADAVCGLPGNVNESYLKYSNNVNDVNGKGETPHDKVVVFTYEIETTKIDGATKNSSNPTALKDAQFQIKKGDNYLHQDDNGYITWGTADGAKTFTSGDDGKFVIKGLDSGTYTFHETKAPAGYNLPANDLTVELTATTSNGQSWDGTPEKALTKLTLKENSQAQEQEQDLEKHGTASQTITNDRGSNLPSTGGMGTTLLYVAGGILVACAAAYVVMSRKHSTNK